MKNILVIFVSILASGCDLSLQSSEVKVLAKEPYFKIYEDTITIQDLINDKIESRVVMVEEELENNQIDKNWYVVSIDNCNKGWGQLMKIDATSQVTKWLFHFNGLSKADEWAKQVCNVKLK